jgi:carboxyl-terminal processing protease
MYRQLVTYAAKDSVNISGLKKRDEDFIRERLKSLSARQIWRTEGFYEVTNVGDPVIKKAMETQAPK